MERKKPRAFRGISDNLKVGIENALSEAMTDPTAPTYKEFNEMSKTERMMDKIGNKARQLQDETFSARAEAGRAQKFASGGDVRFNSSRGKTY